MTPSSPWVWLPAARCAAPASAAACRRLASWTGPGDCGALPAPVRLRLRGDGGSAVKLRAPQRQLWLLAGLSQRLGPVVGLVRPLLCLQIWRGRALCRQTWSSFPG
ncbi:hypothetical protein ZWY2020_055991 [Hordeum vulgare]|nr:hypothetical protein ZWY2020_055991 [Hordeum vulgare]